MNDEQCQMFHEFIFIWFVIEWISPIAFSWSLILGISFNAMDSLAFFTLFISLLTSLLFPCRGLVQDWSDPVRSRVFPVRSGPFLDPLLCSYSIFGPGRSSLVRSSLGLIYAPNKRRTPVTNRGCKHPLPLFPAALQVNLLLKSFSRSNSVCRQSSPLWRVFLLKRRSSVSNAMRTS